MKVRLGNMVNKQFWFILCVALTGGGLIYFLNSIGVIEAMRNDNTLDILYEANMKLPKAPDKVFEEVTESYTIQMNHVLQQEADQSRKISRIDAIVLDKSESKASGQKFKVGSESKGLHIPHIIHQTWDSYSIPATFASRIKSWLQYQPDWDYWFWTSKAVHCFLEKHYPEHVLLYESYPDFTSKADAMRYFILYHFGGFYVDLDTTLLKPLNVWTDNFCCILSEEPYEHSYLVRGENHTSIVNSPMACQSGHSLFKYAISSLPEFAANYLGDYLHSTGPYFLQEVLKRYNNQMQIRSNTGIKTKNNCNITTVPPKYFLPRFDPNQSELIDDKCYSYKTLPPLQRRLCQQRLKAGNKNTVVPESFMDHEWIHVNMLGYDWKDINTVPFFSIVPNAKNLEKEFCSS